LALAILEISVHRGTSAICLLVSSFLVALSTANALERLREAESPHGKDGANRDYSRLQLPFVFQFLLRLFEDVVVDDSVQSELLIDDAAADVFVEHDLNAIYGDRQI
jgi:hypothetical protein